MFLPPNKDWDKGLRLVSVIYNYSDSLISQQRSPVLSEAHLKVHFAGTWCHVLRRDDIEECAALPHDLDGLWKRVLSF